jgi:FKBP-type peptidyl-prolyl cis-trans isomerase
METQNNVQKKVTTAVILLVLIIGGVYWYSLKNKNMDENKKDADVLVENKVSDNGLIIEDVVKGSGDAVKDGETAVVNYRGTFADGKQFDSSYDRGTPFAFIVGKGMVIEGWDKGVLGMQVGGKRKLTVPPLMGYGVNDYGPIPGNSTLYFEVELLKIEK